MTNRAAPWRRMDGVNIHDVCGVRIKHATNARQTKKMIHVRIDSTTPAQYCRTYPSRVRQPTDTEQLENRNFVRIVDETRNASVDSYAACQGLNLPTTHLAELERRLIEQDGRLPRTSRSSSSTASLALTSSIPPSPSNWSMACTSSGHDSRKSPEDTWRQERPSWSEATG